MEVILSFFGFAKAKKEESQSSAVSKRSGNQTNLTTSSTTSQTKPKKMIHNKAQTLRRPEAMAAGTSVPVQAIIEAQSDFALNLLRTNAALESTVLSPISISIALAMTLLGAKNETAKQIRKTIAKDASDEELHAHFASVVQMFKSNDLNVTLDAANRVYVKDSYKLLDEYVAEVKKYYGGELEQVDFTQATATASKINHFVEEVTRNRIKDLISADSLNDLTRVILINAVYFKGDWKTPFDEESTIKNHDFYLDENTTKKVEMMQKETEFAYFETDDFQVLGLPYVGDHVFMYVILPREKSGLGNLLKNLNGPTLAQLLQKRGRTKVNVKLPKFKVESSFELKDQLAKLGLTDCFRDTADFSGMTGNRELYVSSVVHKAFIEVNEKGAEAAAASAVIMSRKAMRPNKPPKVVNFHADHSFLYIITDTKHSNHLFTGVFRG